jgi:prephenate dehydrogenase
MQNKTVTIVGTGLIGGSMAFALRKHRIANHIIGVEKNKKNADCAIKLGIVDEVLPLKDAILQSSLVIVAIPVDGVQKILPQILNTVTTQTVMDVGSTKEAVINSIAAHKKRAQFVATHPMWGTEYSGPLAAQKIAFKKKAVVICNREQSNAESIAFVEHLYKKLGMHILYMDAAAHDTHTAYISHISHITSFALANTVLHKEKQASTIFELASGGFESTVRLAKSNAAMWTPIFLQNKKNILDVLMELEIQIGEFKKHLVQHNEKEINKLIINANKIKKIIQ